MKINILYIIEDLNLGGAERVCIDQARSLDKEKFNVKVCCLREKGEFAPILEQQKIEVIELNKHKGLDFSIIGKIMHVLKQNNIHIVHTHLWVANFWGRMAALLCGVPVVITEHNVDVWKKWYHKILDRALEPFTKRICVVSKEVKKYYCAVVGLREDKMQVVYNGIEARDSDIDKNTLDSLRKELHIHNGHPVLANIGRLVKAKANHVFIDALKELDKRGKDFHALVIGEGPLKNTLEEQSKNLVEKNKLTFTGLRKDVDAILHLTDISVLSSTREGLSVVVLESMLKGIPFVATRVGGNPELIVDQETGFLVEENNPKALADAIEKIMGNPQLAESMGKASRHRIEKEFNLKRMVDETQGIYEEVLAQ